MYICMDPIRSTKVNSTKISGTSSLRKFHPKPLWNIHHIPQKNMKLVGGFKHFLFSPLPGEMIQFHYVFSRGLKPPTRKGFSFVNTWQLSGRLGYVRFGEFSGEAPQEIPEDQRSRDRKMTLLGHGYWINCSYVEKLSNCLWSWNLR